MKKQSPAALTRQERNAFRKTVAWKDHRLSILKERNYQCEICQAVHKGMMSRRLDVHHKDPDNYTNLDKDKFLLLCHQCHDYFHNIARRKIKPTNVNLNAIIGMFLIQ